MNGPSVLTVILNHNKQEDVLDAVKSALEVDYSNHQILVVDNSSTDGSWEVLRKTYPDVSMIQNSTNLGAPSGRNAGWRYAQDHYQFDYIFFLDDDAIVEKKAIQNFVDALEIDKQGGIACGKGYTRYPSKTFNSTGIQSNLYTGVIRDIGAGEEDIGQYEEKRYVAACGGFGLFIRADLFEELKGFDETFNPYGWEDVDLCFRAKKAGFKTLYLPSATIYHKGTKMGRKPLPHYEQAKVKNYLHLIRQHASFTQKVCIFLFLPFRVLLLSIKLISQGHGNIIGAQLKGFFVGLTFKNESTHSGGKSK